MRTVRDIIEEAVARTDDRSARMIVRGLLAEAIKAIDESETAWRGDGGTYRLIEDDIEVPS